MGAAHRRGPRGAQSEPPPYDSTERRTQLAERLRAAGMDEGSIAQLRATGLSPGGQDVAALMVVQRRGRRLVAHLFDIAKARPKRTPSPAQLAAIEKATRTHQLRAA